MCVRHALSIDSGLIWYLCQSLFWRMLFCPHAMRTLYYSLTKQIGLSSVDVFFPILCNEYSYNFDPFDQLVIDVFCCHLWNNFIFLIELWKYVSVLYATLQYTQDSVNALGHSVVQTKKMTRKDYILAVLSKKYMVRASTTGSYKYMYTL